eukprot:8933223-Pyramimonas_sp.AAC.1
MAYSDGANQSRERRWHIPTARTNRGGRIDLLSGETKTAYESTKGLFWRLSTPKCVLLGAREERSRGGQKNRIPR